MFVRPSARQSLSLPRIATLQRPQLARHGSVRPSYSRHLVTRSELLPWRRRTAQNPHGATTQRPLATAVGDTINQDDVPFDRLQSRMPSEYATPPPHLQSYELRAFDPSAPLLVKGNEEPFPRGRTTPNGVPGGVDEMLSVFEACLQVGKLERAALVLQRFGDMAILPGSDLIALHNKYLRAAIDKAFEQPDSKWAQSLHKWYEIHIRGKNIPQTPETIAYMLKVSLLSAQGERLERLVNRYMDMMSEEESMYKLLSEVDILSQQDFGTISSIYQPSSGLFERLELPTEDLGAEISHPTESQTPEGGKPQPTPEVLSVAQKGLGLKTLRGVLSFFKGLDGQDLSKLPYSERREVQSRLEQDCVEAAINRWREENRALMKMGRNSSLSTNSLNPQLYEWQHTMETKLEEEFKLCKEEEKQEGKTSEDMDRCIYAPFLTQSTPPRLAAVTIMSVLNSIASTGADKGIHLSHLISNLSKAVEEDVWFQKRQEQYASRKSEWLKKRREQRLAQQSSTPQKMADSSTVEQPTHAAEQLTDAAEQLTDAAEQPTHEAEQPFDAAEQLFDAVEQPTHAQTESNIVEAPRYETTYWPLLIRTKLGVVLLTTMIDSAKVKVVREHPETKALVSQVQPALTHTTVYRKGKKVGVVMPNKFLVDLMKQEPRADFLARHLPMLVEPEPWTKFDKGGFIEFPSQLVRIKHGERDQKIYAEAALQRGDMEQVSKGLDVLGRTPWQINQPVFDVMLEVWNSGEELANIPPLHPKISIPEEPEKSDDPTKKRDWLKSVKAAENEKSGLHSERCFMNFQLEIARAFKDQTFYFPHNMDFRGRAYPIPTYLNHMGADHVRGLLRFGIGKELGENGIRWLKVHLANVFGYDKASLREREAFTKDHADDISDSAHNPLTGKRWWLKAEDPWQCLAACFELQAALDSPDPTKYVSHLPVHQDGTCNGLQHYAALGGDIWGAQQVNLVPGDRPADVYTAVADLVKESIEEDLKTDNFLAKAVHGKITRKVVKQTVMTNVYGVTFVGAKAQVLKQLDAAYPDLQKQTDIPSVVLASYIATKIFKALSHMFRGAHDIQYWLGECAGRVCRALTPEQLHRIATETPGANKKLQRIKKPAPKKGIEELLSQFRSTIVWTTPLRMPVVQPYRKNGSRIIHTSMQDLTLQIPERSDPVNRRKQLQAFPPNFIHSLDASHMLLSALECDELGLSFAAVHDSFWTHAADVDVMNRVLRDSFIRIHSEDVIKRLASEFAARYKGSVYLATLPRGSDTEKIISSHRKHKHLTMRQELLREHERQQLLQSSDPEEVQKGREMVTPASIFEATSNSQVLNAYDEIAEVGLGDIPDEKTQTPRESTSEIDGDSTSPSGPGEGDISAGEDVDRVKELMSMTNFAATISGLQKKKPTPSKREINVWLPITFPDIPKKGGFDVTALKNSLYFFS